MFSRLSPHTRAVIQALFVTFLWSTSWILIKFGLKDIPPLTFAGLRYSLAFLCLCPVVLSSRAWRMELSSLRRNDWLQLAILGLVFIAITQGAQFIALSYLPATTLTLLINLSVVVVALVGSVVLAERLLARQWFGIGIFFVGIILYFFPVDIPAGERLGLLAAGIVVLANSASSIIGRRVNRSAHINPIIVTFVSIGIGAVILLIVGIAQSGWPQLALNSWLIILWLAGINTAFAFTLWNLTLRTLPAVESSIINNTMLIQIAALAWIFLSERLSPQEILGLAAVAAGVLMVQFKGAGRKQTMVVPAEEI